MPLVVDHEQRRREVAEIAADLVAKLGVERVTVREVAAAAGCSTTVVSHYFHGKRELQLMAFRTAALHARRRMEAVLAGGTGTLQLCLEAMLPLDDARRRDWHVWFAFWGVAVGDPQFAAEQKRRSRYSHELVEHLLRGATADAADAPAGATAPARAAESLVAFVVGIAGQAIFDPELWPPARQSNALRAELRLLGYEPDALVSVQPAALPGPPATAHAAPARDRRAGSKRTRAPAR